MPEYWEGCMDGREDRGLNGHMQVKKRKEMTSKVILEIIERYKEDQAFSPSYDFVLHPFPPPSQGSK
jgi:hypothetical protein